MTLDGARALTGERRRPARFLPERLPPRVEPLIELEDLVRFVEHPVRAFLRQRLGISLRSWSRRGRGRAAGRAGRAGSTGRWDSGCSTRCWPESTGAAPVRPRSLGASCRPISSASRSSTRCIPIARGIVDAGPALVPGGADGEPLEVRVPLSDGRLLNGTVAGIGGDVLLNTTYSRVAPKHRLAAWARLLAIAASHPERPAVRGRRRAGRRLGRRPDRRARAARPTTRPTGAAIATARARDARRSVRPGNARAAADLLQDLGGLRRGAQHGQDARRGRRRRVDERIQARPRGSRARALVALGGELTLDEVLETSRPRTNAVTGWPARRAVTSRAAGPPRCGTGLLDASSG